MNPHPRLRRRQLALATRLAVAALVLSLTSCVKKEVEKEPEPTRENRVAEPAPAPVVVKSILTPIEELGWDAASARIRPIIKDGLNQHSKGQRLLARWAAHKMTWSDVSTAKNETTLARIRKDSEPEMFKRMCFKVKIGQIVKDESHGIKVFRGFFRHSSRPTSFVAIGHTGDLVEQSRARFCGLVAGNYAYQNTAGGQTQTSLLVGMFDLPENKGPPLAEENH